MQVPSIATAFDQPASPERRSQQTRHIRLRLDRHDPAPERRQRPGPVAHVGSQVEDQVARTGERRVELAQAPLT